MQADARNNEVSSVTIANATSGSETDIPCANIVIAAGAWSPRVFEALFPGSGVRLPVGCIAGWSVVVRSPRWTEKRGEEGGCHAVFTTTTQPGYSPELFSRVGGEIYVAGLNSTTEPLPDLPTDAKPRIDRGAVEKLCGTVREVLGVGEDDVEVVREGLCFRPATDRGTPILCRIPDGLLGSGVATRPAPEGGVYLATGHGPWGISMSLGTGKVMAEMIQGRALSADISGLGLDV